jgi:hypothetical protein
MVDRSNTRIIRHSLLSMVGRGASGLVPLALTLLASRDEGLAGAGRVASLLALGYVAGEIADFQSLRDIARASSDDQARRSLPFRVLIFLAIYPAVTAIAWPIASGPIVAAFIGTGFWVVFLNTYSGTALRHSDFVTGAIASVVSLLVLTAAAVIVSRMQLGLLGYSLAVHLARLSEAAVLVGKLTWIRPARFSFRQEFARAKHLLFGTITSTVVNRSLSPLALVLGGPVAAGVFSIGIQLFSALALLPFSIVTSAFPRCRGVANPREALERLRPALRIAVSVCFGLLLPAIPAIVFLGPPLLHLGESWMVWSIVAVVSSIVVEPWILFALAALQLTFNDDRIFTGNVVTSLLLVMAMATATSAVGAAGLAAGYAATRVLALPLVWLPALRKATQEGDLRSAR